MGTSIARGEQSGWDLFNRMHRQLQRLLREYLSQYDITPKQWLAIRYCHEITIIKPAQLAMTLDMDLAGTTRLLQRLEARKLITRNMEVQVERFPVYELTEKSRAMIADLEQAQLSAQAQMTVLFSKDLQDLGIFLQRLTKDGDVQSVDSAIEARD